MIKVSSMQGKLICALALLIVLASACSRQETAKRLARRLSEADRVIVLNPLDGVTMTIKDDLLKKLVQAIEASQKLGFEPDATPSYTLVFFRSGVHLGTVPTSADLNFHIDERVYGDKSGTLRAVWEKFWEKHPSSR